MATKKTPRCKKAKVIQSIKKIDRTRFDQTVDNMLHNRIHKKGKKLNLSKIRKLLTSKEENRNTQQQESSNPLTLNSSFLSTRPVKTIYGAKAKIFKINPNNSDTVKSKKIDNNAISSIQAFTFCKKIQVAHTQQTASNFFINTKPAKYMVEQNDLKIISQEPNKQSKKEKKIKEINNSKFSEYKLEGNIRKHDFATQTHKNRDSILFKQSLLNTAQIIHNNKYIAI